MRKEPIVKTLEVVPPSPHVKGSIALTKMQHVRGELSRLYREVRTGKLDAGTATKLTYMLQVLAKIIQESDIETRLSALEEAQEKSNHDKKFGR